MARGISDSEMKIVSHAYLQGDAPIGSIAKQSGFRAHTVRRVLDKFLGSGALKPVLLVNPYLLGFTEYYTFFSVENSNRATRATLKVLCSQPEIFWVAETGATHRYSTSILARGPRDLARILDSISEKVGDFLRERAVTICHSFYLIAPTWAEQGSLAIPDLWYGDTGNSVDIDAVDHTILRYLGDDPMMSGSALSRKIGLPATTLDYRVKSLRKRGVIVGVQLLPDFEQFGLSQFPVAMYLRRNTPDVQRKILHYARTSGLATYLAFLIGKWDAELGVKVRTPREIGQVIEDLHDLLGADLSRVELYPDFRYHKLSYYPFGEMQK